MSYAGVGALFDFIFYSVLSVLSIYLIVKICTTPKRRIVRSVIVILLIACIIMNYIQKQEQLDKAASGYMGAHKLKLFKGATGCVLTYFPNHNYKVTSDNVVIEEGKWAYFDDGDIGFIEVFPYGIGYHLGHEDDSAPPEYDFDNFMP